MTLFFSKTLCAQPGQSSFATDIENMWRVLGGKIEAAGDSAGTQLMVDSIAKENNWEKTEYARYMVLTAYCNTGRFPEGGTGCLTHFLPLISRLRSDRIKTLFKFSLGDVYCSQLDFSRGMDMMLEAISENKAIGYENVPLISGMFYLLANRYYQFRNYRKAIEYATLACRYMGPRLSLGAYNTVALAYQQLGNYDSAVYHYLVTVEQARKQHVPVWESIALGNLGRVYCLQKNYAQGLPLLLTELARDSAGEKVNASVSALYMAEAYLETKQSDSAKQYLQLGKKIYTGLFPEGSKLYYSSKFCHYYYTLLSQWYQLNGDYPEALRLKDTAISNEKQFNSRLDWQLLTSAEKRVEGLEYQQNVTLLQSQQKAEWLQKILLLVVLSSVLCIGTLVINRQRLKHKKEQQLAREKEAGLRLQEQRARKELEEAKQQLEEFLATVAKQHHYQETIVTELALLSNGNEAARTDESTTHRLTALANSTLLTNEDWQKFQQRFEKVYPGFFASLSVTIPDISAAEERLLALLKMNINNRQMAFMLGITAESVRKARYRLRKKLAASNHAEWLQLLDEPLTTSGKNDSFPLL